MPSPKKLCGSPGCTRPDFHDGLCDADADALLQVPRAARRGSRAANNTSPCVPCDDADDDGVFEVQPPRTKQAPRSDARTKASKPKKQRRSKMEDSDDDGDDEEYVPSGAEEEEEEEEDGDDEDVDSDFEPAASFSKRKPPAAHARKPRRSPAKPAAAAVTAAAPSKPHRAGGKAAASSSAASSSAAHIAPQPAAAQPSASASTEQPEQQQEEGDGLYDFSNLTGVFCAEHAKTGRAKCNVCGELIALKELRIGLERDEKGWGIITRWQHVACSRLPSDVDASRIDGYEKLPADEQARIDEMLAAKGTPAHLRGVDIDEEMTQAAEEWKTQREPPETLLAPMLPYQKEGLVWLCAQEDGEVKGGILADEMGMGKTLQTISLLLAHRAKQRTPACQTCEVEEGLELRGGGTLVILPVIALAQWRTELLKWTAPGTFSIFTYHGPKRDATPEQLASYDVVLTTYSTLEYEYRAAQADLQVKCPYCKRTFKSDQKLAFHNRWFCGPNARRSAAQAKTQSRRRQYDEDDDDEDDEDEDGDWQGSEEDEKGKAKSKGKGAKQAAPSKAKGAAGKAAAKGKEAAASSSTTTKGGKKPVKDASVVASKGRQGQGRMGKGVVLGGGKSGAKGKRKATDSDPGDDDDGEDDEDDDDDDKDQEDDGGEDGAPKLSARALAAQRKARAAAAVAAKSVLHRVAWQRIVLDEAHAIKDRRCSTAQGCFALHASFRWCLSGTPLQNRVGELYSLIQFCRLDPYCFYFCKVDGCDCKCREYHFDAEYRKCMYCGHSPLQHFSLFNQDVVNPIKKFGYVGAGKNAFITLKRGVLDRLLLRRTKAGRADEMVLPPKVVTIEAHFLDHRETDFYQGLYTQSQAQFGAYVEAGTLLNNYAHVLDLLTRLRQAINHPYLVLYSKREMANADAERDADGGTGGARSSARGGAAGGGAPGQGFICGLCYEEGEDVVLTGCGHPFCRGCMREYIDALAPDAVSACPTCEQPLSVDLHAASISSLSASAAYTAGPATTSAAQVAAAGVSAAGQSKAGLLARLDLRKFQSSTKIEALMEELHLMREHDPSAKAIVFSQFVSFLDIVEHRLLLAGIRVVKLNGGMTAGARETFLKAFREDPAVVVILISLKAGGVALNLTVASHIYLMDPWWNPAAEYQAIDRAHRLGQHKPIRAVRFVVRNTVEERILRLQDKKRLVFEGTVGGDAKALGQLSEEDLRFLFS